MPFPVGLLIVVLCQAGLSVVGYEAIHTFEKYAAIGLAVLFGVVTIAVLSEGQLRPGRRYGLGALARSSS